MVRSASATTEDTRSDDRRPDGNRILAGMAVAVLAVLAGGALWWRWADLFATGTSRLVRFHAVPILMVLTVVGAFIGAFASLVGLPRVAKNRPRPAPAIETYDEAVRRQRTRLVDTSESDRWWRPDRTGSVLAFAAFFGLVATVGGFFVIRTLNRYAYEVEHRIARAAVAEVDGNEPGHDPRLAYPQAVERINNSLGDFRGTALDPMYVVTAEGGNWCSLLIVDTWRKGTQGVACLLGDAEKATVVRFTGEVPSERAKWRLDLRRRVANIAKGASYEEGDVYGYLDSEGPHMVVPLRKTVGGWFHPYDAPAGAVVYGPDGDARWIQNVKPGEIPGPVVGLSMAVDVRSAIDARGTFKQHFQNRLSFKDTASASGEITAADPSAANLTEFVLRRSGQTGAAGDFVTPLRPWGRSASVVAVATSPFDASIKGKMPQIVLHRLPEERIANRDALGIIATRYANVIAFANSNEPEQGATRLKVMEITPGPTPERWQVTVGLSTRTSYRIEIGPRGATCVFSAGGEKLRCDPADAGPVPPGSLGGTPSAPGPVPSAPGDPNLAALPVGELIAQRNRLQAEIDRRAGGR